jgi:hypothetical protein
LLDDRQDDVFTQAGFCHPNNIFVLQDRFLLSAARDDYQDGHDYGSENALHCRSAPKEEIKDIAIQEQGIAEKF